MAFMQGDAEIKFSFFQTAMALEATFKQTAESFSKEINQTLTNDDLKEVYGLYKQVLDRANR